MNEVTTEVLVSLSRKMVGRTSRIQQVDVDVDIEFRGLLMDSNSSNKSENGDWYMAEGDIASSRDTSHDSVGDGTLSTTSQPTTPTHPQHQQHPPLQEAPLSPSRTTSSSSSTALYASLYFSCMIVMEIVLEGTQNAFNDLRALPFCITLFQFTFSFLFPVAMSKGKSIRRFPRTFQEVLPFFVLSLVLFSSTCFASLSVRYVSFPTKIVFKSTKLIPTMVFAVLLKNNRRPIKVEDFCAAILLSSGATGYSIGESHPAVVEANQKSDSYIGILLLSGVAICDALFPNLQQRLMMSKTTPRQRSLGSLSFTEERSRLLLPSLSFPDIHRCASVERGDHCRHRQQPTNDRRSKSCTTSIGATILPPLGLSAAELMTNAYAVGGFGVILYVIVRGHLSEALSVLQSRPYLSTNLAFIGISFSIATWAFTRLIHQSGSVTAVTVATLRKFVTVILSYILYPKVFSTLHAVSGVLIFGGILLSCYNEIDLTPSIQDMDTSTLSTTSETPATPSSFHPMKTLVETGMGGKSNRAVLQKMSSEPITTSQPHPQLTPRSKPKSRLAENSPILNRLGLTGRFLDNDAEKVSSPTVTLDDE